MIEDAYRDRLPIEYEFEAAIEADHWQLVASLCRSRALCDRDNSFTWLAGRWVESGFVPRTRESAQ